MSCCLDGSGHEGLKRGREAVARAAILTTLSTRNLVSISSVRRACSSPAEVHARTSRRSGHRRRVRDQRQQHVRRHLRRGAGHLVQHRVEFFGLALGGVVGEAVHQLEQRLALLDRVVAAGLADVLQALRELREAIRICRRAPSCSAWWRCSIAFAAFVPFVLERRPGCDPR